MSKRIVAAAKAFAALTVDDLCSLSSKVEDAPLQSIPRMLGMLAEHSREFLKPTSYEIKLCRDSKRVAVRAYRNRTGVSETEARDALAMADLEVLKVENLGTIDATSVPAGPLQATTPLALNIEEERAVRRGKLVTAMKMYRERTGLGLRMSREAMEAYRQSLPPNERHGSESLASADDIPL